MFVASSQTSPSYFGVCIDNIFFKYSSGNSLSPLSVTPLLIASIRFLLNYSRVYMGSSLAGAKLGLHLFTAITFPTKYNPHLKRVI